MFDRHQKKWTEHKQILKLWLLVLMHDILYTFI